MKTFKVKISIDTSFTIDELWPDGDAPKNPTAKDVVNLINECGGVKTIIDDWNLDSFIECLVHDGERIEYIP